MRYVKADGEIVERFFGFISIKSHKAEHIKDIILKKIFDLGLDVKNCRGQYYDNASNMSGIYGGFQAKKYLKKVRQHFICIVQLIC